MQSVIQISAAVRGKYFGLVPAIYFLLLGIFDIGMDAWYNSLSWFFVLCNLAFFIPIIFRNRRVYLICGICFSALWTYLFFASLILIPKGNGLSALQIVGVELFLLFSLACSVSMLYAGSKKFR